MRRPLSVALCLSLAVPLAALDPTGHGAAAPAPRPRATAAGFRDTKIGDVASITTIAALPEARAAVLAQGGQVRIVVNGELAGIGLDLSDVVCAGGERGLLGFAADPAVQTNGRVYLYYTYRGRSGCVNRVSRFTMATPTTIARASEVVLLDNISSANGNHNGGDVEIGSDGYLYVAVGDAGCNPRDCTQKGGANTAAQDVSLLNGKILRVSPIDGSPAPDNPFASAPGSAVCRTRGNTASTPTTPCREIFAVGLRNPYRFAFDPDAGGTRFHINDVGQGTREEVNLGSSGANYGWPMREGVCAQGQSPPCAPAGADLTDPIADYGRSVGTFITAGAFVPRGVWPAPYDGAYLFADGGAGRIFVRPASTGDAYSPVFQTFATGAIGITDMAFVMEPGGYALYYAQGGDLRKLTYDAPAQPAAGPLVYAARAGGPLRAFDSRNGSDPGVVRAGTTRHVASGAPGTATKAALVNITMITPTSGGYMTAWAARTDRPPSSNINGATGEVAANTSIVPVDASGEMVIYTSATADVIVDVVGYFADAPSAVAAGRLIATPPRRYVDTRQPPSSTNLYAESGHAPDTTVEVPVVGPTRLPSSGVAFVAAIVTATSEQLRASGYVTVTPSGAPEGPDSSVNVNGSGDVRPNLVIVPVGSNGNVTLRLHDVSDVLVDVVGYVTDGAAPPATAGRFRLLQAARELDTRIGLGGPRLTADVPRTVDPVVVPGSASAVAQNIVVTANAAPGFVTSYPADISAPMVSNGNTSAPDQTRSALSVTKLASGGGLSYVSNRDTDLIVDVFGYFEG